MPTAMPAKDVLDREFLEIRAKILEIAASLDRMDRGSGTVDGDPRRQLVQQGISILLEADSGRAERVQVLFSRSFDPQWREQLGV